MLFKKKHKIGDTISKLRKKMGWTQNELAEKLQVSDKAVSKWESNKGDPSIEFLPVLAELFGVTLDYLMTGKEAEEKVVTMSKLELCAKKDDVNLYEKLGFSIDYKDENGKTILDYVFEYESKKIFLKISKNYEYGMRAHKNDITFLEKFYYMRLLCNDTSMLRDFVRLEYKDSTIDNHLDSYKDYIGYNGSRYVPIRRQIVSDRIIDLLIYGKNTDKNIRSEMLSLNEDDNAKFYSPALFYSYIVLYVLKQKDWKLAKQLIENARSYDIKNSERKYVSGSYIGHVEYPKQVFDILLDNMQFELLTLVNETNMRNKEKNYYSSLHKVYVIEDLSYQIESSKVRHDEKISPKEKSLKLAIHDGIVSLDELIAINDFDLYEKTIKNYPISIYEKGYELIDKKDYKGLFSFINKIGGFETVIKDLKNKDIDKLQKDYKGSLGYLKSSDELNSKYLKKYIYDNHRGLLSSSFINKNLGIDTSASRENFYKAKNYIVLESVLNNDVRFIEKACKTATQQELDDALTQIQPNNFKGIDILLNYGAKVHKKWVDSDGDRRDEIDEIGTEVLKQNIKDILRRK